MVDSGFFSVSDFARLSRTTRDALHHYDKIGLLSPVSRGENKYRYYSSGQLAAVNLIRTLQALGMPLAEIKALKDGRTPECMDEILSSQIEKIDQKVDEWLDARKLLLTLRKSINSVLDVDENALSIQQLPAEPIILGGQNDYRGARNDFDALFDFYEAMRGKYPKLNLNYPVWGFFREERIKRGDWVWPDRYYFYNPEGTDYKPAGFYAIGYSRGGYGASGALYGRLLEYAEARGFEIGGNAYEEYPLNELSVSDDAGYLSRVMIAVREKAAPSG